MNMLRIRHSLRLHRVFGTTCLIALSLGVIGYHRSSAAAVNLKETPEPVEVVNPLEVKGVGAASFIASIIGYLEDI